MSDAPSHDEFAFGQLMATRLCHDLAGAVGAVSQGVELLAMDPESVDADTIGLVSSSADSVAIKLKVMRAAFGWSGSGALGLADVADLMRSYFGAVHSGAPIAVDWPSNPMALQPLQDAYGGSAPALVLNLILMAYELRPLTHSLLCSVSETGSELIISNHPIAGRNDLPRQDLVDTALGSEADLSPKTIQAAVTRRLAVTGGGLSISVDEGVVKVTLATS